MHDDVHWPSLLFVYGLLLGNYGYQTDRKIYDQREIAARLRSSQCQNYGSLNSYIRKITYSGGSYCDRGIGPGWFRFEWSAGTRLPTSCPPMFRCGTTVTGWLNGGHPTVADGQVSRQVCFHWSSNCCYWSTNIKVRNCGSYYVYYLNGTPSGQCDLRYCCTD
ncbi:unnamed protein product [Porites lobata]|uniref:UMOD/GP2/OIT3-like D8C domain-containing protein n=1 Tax=Porites lobata TaxID=104759 RepID=A0ABN8P4N4_9CNID|nr:unnamed protein product [Porites lobata]